MSPSPTNSAIAAAKGPKPTHAACSNCSRMFVLLSGQETLCGTCLGSLVENVEDDPVVTPLGLAMQTALASITELRHERDAAIAERDMYKSMCDEKHIIEITDLCNRRSEELSQALAKLAEVESDLEKLRLHAAAFPGKPDWIGEHLQKWIQSKDDRAVWSVKIAHQALDEKLAALTRAEQSEALLRESRPLVCSIAADDRNEHWQQAADVTKRITAHLAPKETT